MAKSIEAIEGIGPAHGAKLRALGCGSPAKVLAAGASRQGRSQVAQKTGISESVILRCVNMADAFRVK